MAGSVFSGKLQSRMQKIGKWCETLLPRSPAEMIFSVEFVRILSISDGEQPGFSCVASEITGMKLLLYSSYFQIG